MSAYPFRLEQLRPEHDRKMFRCGQDALDIYFGGRRFRTSAVIANCFVAVEAASGLVAAYYTLSAASIPLVDLSAEETKRLPRYPTLPAVRIGRLAVDEKFQSCGLEAALLADREIVSESIAALG
jgi:hypothetical protein